MFTRSTTKIDYSNVPPATWWISVSAIVGLCTAATALRCPGCGATMTPLALVRAGAGGVLAWLRGAGERVLLGGCARDGPAPRAVGSA